MNQTLVHRGPDDGGEYLDSGISLGSRRLSILDISTKGHMPMSTTNKRFWIVYNGEVYNFKAIRSQLIKKGYKFKSETDTEVVLVGFQHYGKDIVKKLNGMFAFSIWDAKEKSLFLARDRIGIKPLYYYHRDGKLIFSSEIKAMLKHKIKKQIDLTALNLYFRLLYVPSPLTMFQGIKKLPPGHTLTWKSGKIKIKSFWSTSDIKPVFLSQSELVTRLDSALTQSVKRNLISDRPIGIFLSGGIDSSLILAFATKIKRSPPKTYTIGFKVNVESEKFNQDLNAARVTSKLFKSDHHELLISAKDVIDNMSKVIYHLDEPISNPTQIATYLLSKLASKDVAVVLSGDGGDELFAGYGRYRNLHFLSQYQKLPNAFRHQIPKFFSTFSPKLQDMANKANINEAEKIQLLLVSQSEDTISKLLSKEINQPKLTPGFFRQFFTSKDKLSPEEFLNCDLQTWLPSESLIKSDKLTMAHSLEQRVPLLDNIIVNLALQAPFQQKISLINTKKILRKTAANYLPHEITQAPKWGWFSPTSKWLRTGLKNFARESLSNNNLKEVRNYLNPVYARQLFKSHLNGQYHPHEIWSIITFAKWHQTFFKH